jgi:ureidoglycolate lyase
METITAKKLTPESFAKYGVYHNLLDDAANAAKSVLPPDIGFYPDLVPLDFGRQNLPTISICQVKKTEKNIVAFLEAHRYTCEGLLPLDGDVVIFVGPPPFGDPPQFSVKTLEAFIVPRGTFVKLNPLIVHGTQYAIDSGTVHIVCMLPGRTFANDMLARMIEKDEEKAEIVL